MELAGGACVLQAAAAHLGEREGSVLRVVVPTNDNLVRVGLRREPKIQAKLRVADLGGGSVVGPIATVDEDVTHRKRRGGSREGGIWCGEGGIWWLRQLCLVAMGI